MKPWRLSLGCGAISLLLLVVLGLPMVCVMASGDSGGQLAGAPIGNVGPAGGLGTAVATAWKPYFPWTPAAGFTDANGWPWGQCTWFVVREGHGAGDHRIHWSGDAWQWIATAHAAGARTNPAGTAPEIGWIAVYQRGHGSDPVAGHVAVVVAVSANTYTIAEANFTGLGGVDTRTLPWPQTSANWDPLLEGWIP